MELKLIKIKQPTFPNLEECIEGVNLITQTFTQQALQLQEKQTVNALARKGFTFKNKEDLYTFAKEHCKLVSQGYTRTLLVDEDPVCFWDDTPEFKREGNTFSVTFGQFKYL